MTSSTPELEDLLRQSMPGLAVAGPGDRGVEAPPEALVARLVTFVRLLDKWNRAYNLTSVRDPAAMLVRHILDSLSALPFLAGSRVLDVGSGAGLPGIPLALAEPDRHYTLLDSGAKKIRFIRQAVTELRIPNVDTAHARLEDYAPMQPFNTIICRAFASLEAFASASGPLLADDGRLLAMKGRIADDELAALPAAWTIREVAPLDVPGLSAERHMVVMTRRLAEPDADAAAEPELAT